MHSVSLEEAAAAIPDGATVYLGGAVLNRRPVAVCRGLVDRGARDLDVVTLAGSVDVDMLVGAGCVRSVRSCYVGMGHAGFAPNFSAAVKAAAISDIEYSEWTMLQGLRAAAEGLPFLPTRAGGGSDVVAALDFKEVVDPYTGTPYLAVPPLKPEIAVIHAWRSSPGGDIQFGWPPEHLWDVDILAARAAGLVVVTVEELATAEEVAARSELTRLFGFEVDFLVHAPAGSWPTACPPVADVDEHALDEYVRRGGDLAALEVQGR
ncbi:MAG: CoA transferase subunit A [Nostocoides sp.]